MPDEQRDYKAFRQRLDATLRQRDPAALRAFLVAEGQWQTDAQTDAEAAMWMMIAASPALKDLRGDAERWLLTHGHEAEAGAILGSRRPTSASSASSAHPSAHPSARPSSADRPRHNPSASHRPPSKPGAPQRRHTTNPPPTSPGRPPHRPTRSRPPEGKKRPQ